MDGAPVEVTPTVEELICSVLLRDFSATSSNPIFVAPFPLKVISASLIVWGSSVVTSDTNYWKLYIDKAAAIGGATTEIAFKHTKVTGGTAIVTRVDWNYNTVSWDATEATFATGDVLQFVAYKTGAPTTLTTPLLTVRYSPL